MFKTDTLQATKTPLSKKPNQYYLFIHWKEGVRKYGPQTSTYNGDMYDKHDLSAQFINLIKILMKQIHNVKVAVLYDSRFPKYAPERDIVKFCNGVMEINRLDENFYRSLLNNFPLPDYLK